jgi:hypothetical protein
MACIAYMLVGKLKSRREGVPARVVDMDVVQMLYLSLSFMGSGPLSKLIRKDTVSSRTRNS